VKDVASFNQIEQQFKGNIALLQARTDMMRKPDTFLGALVEHLLL